MSQSMREIVCDILTRDAAGETLEEMVSALEDIRSAALEEAARVCRAIEDGKFVAGAIWHNDAGSCAAAIRARKEAEHGN